MKDDYLLKFFYDKSVLDMSYPAINKTINDAMSRKDYDTAYKFIHDAVLYIMCGVPEFNYWYDKEPDDVAHFKASYILDRNLKLVATWMHPITGYMVYIRKSIWRSIWYFREHDMGIDSYGIFKNDPDAIEQLTVISGYKDHSSYYMNQIIESDSTKELTVEDIFDYVFKMHCMYNELSNEYKYLKLSVMLSIVRQDIIVYKLSDNFKPQVHYLVNCYNKYYMQYVEKGVIKVDT